VVVSAGLALIAYTGDFSMIKGSCACAKICYEVDGELTDFSHCHCSKCRKLHGAAFATWGGVRRAEFSYVSGQGYVMKYAFSETSDSVFCSHCGSRLLVESRDEPDMLYITLGTVDGEVSCLPGFHEYVGSKAPWYDICDDLPQFDASSPEV